MTHVTPSLTCDWSPEADGGGPFDQRDKRGVDLRDRDLFMFARFQTSMEKMNLQGVFHNITSPDYNDIAWTNIKHSSVTHRM